jgi:hypothetical protein
MPLLPSIRLENLMRIALFLAACLALSACGNGIPLIPFI